MEASRTAEETREVNSRYHDVAAGGYDFKWGIDFGPVGRAQVLSKLRKLLAGELEHGFQRALEVGAGTGYFSLNLLGAGVIDDVTCTDISPGMITTLRANAKRLGMDVKAVCADAGSLPFPDASFDLVLGHAVLHHVPDLWRAFAEFHRVLAPGGRIAFAGEPSQAGDRLAAIPKRGAKALAPIWRLVLGTQALAPAVASPAEDRSDQTDQSDHALERCVDVHTFTPRELTDYARRAGFADVRVRGEELMASWFGWFNRGLEASADPDGVPMLWRQYAFHGYLLLQRLDHQLLERSLPPAIFYNLLLTARKA